MAELESYYNLVNQQTNINTYLIRTISSRILFVIRKNNTFTKSELILKKQMVMDQINKFQNKIHISDKMETISRLCQTEVPVSPIRLNSYKLTKAELFVYAEDVESIEQTLKGTDI